MQGTLHFDGAPNPDPREAARVLRRGRGPRPKSPLAHVCLAVALQREKKYTEATRELSEATRLKPDNADAQVALGYAMAQAEKLDEAIASFRKAIGIKPDNSPESRLARQRQAVEARGKFDEAIAAFREAIRIDRNEGQYTWTSATRCKIGASSTKRSRRYREAIRLEPADADPF